MNMHLRQLQHIVMMVRLMRRLIAGGRMSGRRETQQTYY
ncbi:hypothetical protein NITLEN_40032 [Nitrospira lenta]|uniref:Uncharacterized protein n=1 Tax=Nitrospira lenta TaxID=1436998 RepID=A0A330L8H5_9BACT|nr:hypothetical protein NITLEN_40032 [Nitrospira lenta]